MIAMRVFSLVGIVLAFVSISNQLEGQSEKPALKQWQEDIDFAIRTIKRKHKKPFHFISESELDQRAVRLKSKVGACETFQIVLELEKLGASIGDGHTWITDRFRRDPYLLYPVLFRWFHDGFYVVGIQNDLSEMLGFRLIMLNNEPLAEATGRLRGYISAGENEYFMRYWEGYWLRNADALFHEGISSSRREINLVLENSSGLRKVVTLRSMPANESLKSVSWAYQPPPRFLLRQNEAVWYELYGDRKLFYIKVNRFGPEKEVRKISAEILKEVRMLNPVKIVFDLRNNGGGDKTTVEELVNSLARDGWDKKARFYAITGDHTFSAALATAMHLKRKTGAKIVGEPPTNRPNFFAENYFSNLPNSGICISVAAHQYVFQQDDSPELKLDRNFTREFSDYRLGRDPIIEWVLRD